MIMDGTQILFKYSAKTMRQLWINWKRERIILLPSFEELIESQILKWFGRPVLPRADSLTLRQSTGASEASNGTSHSRCSISSRGVPLTSTSRKTSTRLLRLVAQSTRTILLTWTRVRRINNLWSTWWTSRMTEHRWKAISKLKTLNLWSPLL